MTAPRGRSIAAGVLGVLAVVVLTVTTFAVWARATAFDGERVAGIVGDAVAEPEVQSALAGYVTEQVFAAVDIEALLATVLPPVLERLEPVIAVGIRTAVDDGLTRLLADPDVQRVLTGVVERAHARAMRLLEGDGLVDGITIADGVVTVNLLPFVGLGLERVQELGLLTGVEIPALTADGDPDEQVAALSAAIGRDLPAGFGQLAVYRSERLGDAEASVGSAQRLVVLAKRAVWVLVALSVALVAATLVVARRRWRAALLLATGVAAAMVLTRSAVRRVVDDAPALAERPGGRAAIDAILTSATASLLRLAGLVLLVAVAVVALAVFRRRWQRSDLLLVAAVGLGAAVIAVLDVGVVSVLLGVAVASAVPVVAGRLLPPPRAPSTA